MPADKRLVRMTCQGIYLVARIAMVLITCFATGITCSGQVLHRKTLEGNQGKLLSPSSNEETIKLEEEQFLEFKWHSVSRNYFTEQMEKARSYHDFLRIFYDNDLDDETIDSLVASQSGVPRGGLRRSRTRVGLDDTMAYSPAHSLSKGTYPRSRRRFNDTVSEALAQLDQAPEDLNYHIPMSWPSNLSSSAHAHRHIRSRSDSSRKQRMLERQRKQRLKQWKKRQRERDKERRQNAKRQRARKRDRKRRKKGKKCKNRDDCRKGKKDAPDPVVEPDELDKTWHRASGFHSSHGLANTQADLKKAFSHLEYVTQWGSCKEPVPKLIHIRDIVKDPTKEFSPRCTVVHKCSRETGCCDANSSCEPKSVVNITQAFYVLDVIGDGELKPNSHIVQYQTFENHTECECRKRTPLTACLPCPSLFTVQRDKRTMQCLCVCKSNGHRNGQCRRIKRGQETLPESELVCMKSQGCGIPQCDHGEFSIQNGRCPTPEADEDNLSAASGGSSSAIKRLGDRDLL